jgi:vesicle coat complex subunit
VGAMTDSSTDIDVRGKVLGIAMKMVTSGNVKQVLSFLEKDLVKTIEQDYENVAPTQSYILMIEY